MVVAGAYLIQVAEFVVVFLTHNLIIYWLRGMDMVELALGDLFGSGCNRTRDLCKRSEKLKLQENSWNSSWLALRCCLSSSLAPWFCWASAAWRVLLEAQLHNGHAAWPSPGELKRRKSRKRWLLLVIVWSSRRWEWSWRWCFVFFF